jgi:hypothetical protein
MEKTYNFKFSSGSVQFEIQSDDKHFIDDKIKEFVHLSTGSIQKEPTPQIEKIAPTEVIIEKKQKKTGPKPIKKGKKTRGPKVAEIVEVEEVIEAEKVANAILSSSFSSNINKKILNTKNQLNRILISFYFILEVYGEIGVPSTFISEVTAQLGNEINKTNISTQLKKHSHLFSSSDTPTRGKTVKYQLSNAGLNEVQLLLRGLG